MKIGGIIAEYNPFHNGHKYLVDEFRKKNECTHILSVMSGNFVQRGGPACIDKFSRAEMAVRSGVDLVIELPAYFATQTAEIFAQGAIKTLDSLNCVEEICFGTEFGMTEKLMEVAKVLTGITGNYNESLLKNLEQGDSFVVSREKSIKDNLPHISSEFLKSSNNILAIEYMKALILAKSGINPCAIKRVGSDHNSSELQVENNFSKKDSEKKLDKVDTKFSSATAIRKYMYKIENGEEILSSLDCVIPRATLDILSESRKKGLEIISEEDFFEEICLTLIREEERLENYFEVVEGIHNMLRKRAIDSQNMGELIEKSTSKRYTSSKIRRTLFNILLDIQKKDVEMIKKIDNIPYIRVLAFNSKGIEIISKIKEKSHVEVITSLAKSKKGDLYKNNNLFKTMIDFDIKSSNMFYQKYFSKNRCMFSKGEPDYIDLRIVNLK